MYVALGQTDDLKDWPIKEEICNDFSSCLSECVKKLPPTRQFTEILDCSDQCAVTHCKEVVHEDSLPPKTKKEREAPPKPKKETAHPANTDAEFGTTGGANSGPPSDDEIRNAIADNPGIDRKELLGLFKSRLETEEEMTEFKAATRRVANLDKETGALSVKN